MSAVSEEPGKGERVRVALHEGWAQLVLANPPHGYFDRGSERALMDALDMVLDAPGIRAVVLTGGQEGVFVRHYDVGVIERNGRTLVERGLHFSPESPPDESGFSRCTRRIETCGRIFIAAINGACMGGGLELALACHLRYAQSGDYLLGLPEIQLGILPGGGGTQKLGQAVGHTRALEMLLRGSCVDPQTAARIGLVHATVPDVAAHAQAVAAELAQRSPLALAHIARLHAAAARTGGQAGAEERGAFAEVMCSPFALQAMAAFNAGTRAFPEAQPRGDGQAGTGHAA